jgi:REP element-mobilizing transposase RayT
MGRPLRLLAPTTTWFVTTRCVDSRFFLRPDAPLNTVLGLCLARACKRHPGISVLGFVALSNHLHILLVDEQSQLSSFMELLLGTLAKAVNAQRKRRGHVFERRFSAEPVLDPWALHDRWLYLALNPVRAGLVARHEQWPGLCLLASGHAPQSYLFRRFRHDRYEAARRATPADQAAPSPMDFYEEETVTVAPLPEAVREPGSAQSGQTRVEELRTWEGRIAEERRKRGLGFLGKERVLAQDPFAEPTRPKRSPRPLCHTVRAELYQQYRDLVRMLGRAYAAASAAFRQGSFTVEFPLYMFRPPVPILSPD